VGKVHRAAKVVKAVDEKRDRKDRLNNAEEKKNSPSGDLGSFSANKSILFKKRIYLGVHKQADRIPETGTYD
jgi:hypothetical protein